MSSKTYWRRYSNFLWAIPSISGASKVALLVKNHACQCKRDRRDGGSIWVRKIPWRRAWQPTPILLPGESHGRKSLLGYGPWGDKESDVLKQLSMHTHKQHIYSVFLVSEINPIVCYSRQAQNLSTEKESCLFLCVFLWAGKSLPEALQLTPLPPYIISYSGSHAHH